ncbi:MAG: pyrroloquinoline quinone biosynthesis protein PqqE [Candidatus Korobacteraceae bacterium]
MALIAEITHRCPLHCVYCSNPVQLVATKAELSTGEWVRVFQEASRLGILHLHLTGGEPAARTDLEELIAGAREAGLYTNLITSGLGVSEGRLSKLVDAGLDHIQLSFQDSRDEPAKWIAGAKGHAYKVVLAEKIRQLPVAFTVNLVVHRQNLDHIEEMIEFIEQLHPERVEIAHAQYYGWALKNRDALLPTPQQLENCLHAVERAQQRLAGKMRIDSVVPDYYARYPKACMGGWGRRLMLIDPCGQALPCHAAGVIPGMQFDNVLEHPLEWIWRESTAFQRFRGEEWMPEPCKSCDRRTEDFGGCRCQALLLTGDANATDPVCSLSPDHHLIETARAAAKSDSAEVSWSYRTNVG